VKFQDFGVIAGMGRLERIYFLTEQGADVVADFSQRDPADIRYPRYGLRYQNDYFHRKAFIDVHIWLTQWVEAHATASLEFFNPYFIKDQNRRSINQFRFKLSDYRSPFDRLTIEPNGVFGIQKGDTALLCAVEVHRKPDSKAILKQLDQHIDAMSSDQNLIPERFNHHAPCFVRSLHEHLSSFKKVQERLGHMADFDAFQPSFHFNLMDNIRQNKGQWTMADGSPSELFV
jgi:hypothetical protein